MNWMVQAAFETELQKIAEYRVASGLQDIQKKIERLRKTDHTQQSTENDVGNFAEKQAGASWVKALSRRARGIYETATKTPVRKGMTATIAATAVAAPAAYAGYQGGKASVSGYALFAELVTRASARFPNVPRAKIEQLVAEAMSRRGLSKGASDGTGTRRS